MSICSSATPPKNKLYVRRVHVESKVRFKETDEDDGWLTGGVSVRLDKNRILCLEAIGDIEEFCCICDFRRIAKQVEGKDNPLAEFCLQAVSFYVEVTHLDYGKCKECGNDPAVLKEL